uniref:Adenylosuccinate synthetase n=1 Tax=Theileria parva TaxID=5875 RepID=PURA_THEPA|nr:RecName: Full=Adenylosuccinate synthetase; Short=AMPSase; Short=AdSS; AltName: Full=IMP--aspartate ligase [Theileria parva]|eukprot:XP_763668.1 adenylosuccinate synthase [Theileria parva strain Muguga]
MLFQVVLISGMQWGDEGKGKLVSLLSKDFDLVARYNGGHNSGHELFLDGVKYKLHLLPCGCLYPNTVNVLGNGVVVHLESLINEIDNLTKLGVDLTNRLFISERAHLVFDLHIAVDAQLENEQGEHSTSIGTTKRGIGPTNSTKCKRTGIQIGEMLNWDNFEKLLSKLTYKLCHENKVFTNSDTRDLLNKQLEQHKVNFSKIADSVVDTSYMIQKYIKEGKKVFFEGANGSLLDLALGTYPYVTSSNTTTSGVYNGLGINPNVKILKVGVLKAYQTRVGKGPFPTELFDENFNKLQKFGAEFGVTTGRVRRCGWLDLVAAKYVQNFSGFDLINLSKLDILSQFDEIKLCTHYKHKLTGKLLEEGRYPSCCYQYDEYEPVYKTMPGWKTDISKFKTFEELPQNAQNYVLFIEEYLGVFIYWIGTGRDVNSMIVRT